MTTTTESKDEIVTLIGQTRAYLADLGKTEPNYNEIREALKQITKKAWINVPILNAVAAALKDEPPGAPKTEVTNSGVIHIGGVSDAPTTRTPAPGGTANGHPVQGTTPITPPVAPPPPPTPEQVEAARKARREALERRQGVHEVFTSKSASTAPSSSATTYLRIRNLRVKVQSRQISVWGPNGWNSLASLTRDEDVKDCAILAYEILIGPWAPDKMEENDDA